MADGTVSVPRRKARVRLSDSGQAQTGLSGPVQPQNGGSGAHVSRASAITPYSLAYALPGGLAKLAYPSWMYAPYIRYIEDRLLPVVTGDKSIFVMLSAPPRHGKTQFISKILPPWFLGRNPNKRVILVTYNSDFSKQQGRVARNIFEKWGQAVFGLKVAQDSSSASHWDIEGHEGGMEAIGAEGSITGKGAHLLIIDDPLKGFEAAISENIQQRVWEWFITDVYTRLEPGASVIIVMTRWTLGDLIGRIQEKQRMSIEEMEASEEGGETAFEGWETINFPALATSESDILGRKIGQALFPQRYSEGRLRTIRANMDPFWWNALYQGNPVPISGTMINIEWFKGSGRQYDMPPPRREFDLLLISTDTANKDTELADYTVFGIWGVKDGFYYLLDVIRDKMEFPELLIMSRALNESWRPDFFLIEDKGSGINLIQTLRKEGMSCVRPIDPHNESKILRMQAETPSIRSGKVRVPKDASWLESFFVECRSFPRGKKDQVDMLSQFLKFMREQGGGMVKMW